MKEDEEIDGGVFRVNEVTISVVLLDRKMEQVEALGGDSEGFAHPLQFWWSRIDCGWWGKKVPSSQGEMDYSPGPFFSWRGIEW